VVTARVAPMPDERLDQWRAAAADAGTPLPEPVAGDGYDAVVLELDDVEVGGAVLTYDEQGGRRRASVRRLHTTLPHDDGPSWVPVLAALEQHARRRGVQTIVTAVAPALAGAFRQAGYQATMTTVSKRLDPGSAPELQEDRRVAVRPMERAERELFATEVMTFLRAGMERAGVLAGTGADLSELTERVARLADEPPPDGELLMMGLLGAEPVGRAWATLVTGDDGAVDFHGNTIDLFPQFRGQGLTRSFLGALRRHVREIGVRDVLLRVYAHDAGARQTFLDNGAGIDDVHLRKDLA
jgi:GNAT superfamily N-acetyltransferase